MTPKEEMRLFQKLDAMDEKLVTLQIDFAKVKTELKLKASVWSVATSFITTIITTVMVLLIGNKQ